MWKVQETFAKGRQSSKRILFLTSSFSKVWTHARVNENAARSVNKWSTVEWYWKTSCLCQYSVKVRLVLVKASVQFTQQYGNLFVPRSFLCCGPHKAVFKGTCHWRFPPIAEFRRKWKLWGALMKSFSFPYISEFWWTLAPWPKC